MVLKIVYSNINEAVSLDAPETRVKEVNLRLYVDSYHGGEKENRGSRTGLIIYTNKELIQ